MDKQHIGIAIHSFVPCTCNRW